MKKGIQLVILCALLSIICIVNSNAQVAQAQYSETAMGTTVNGRNTGNDILLHNSDTIEVSVWEDIGGNSGFGWNVHTGASTVSGILPLQHNPAGIDPDVSIVLDVYDTVYAIVAYHDGTDIIMDSYKWTGSTFVWDDVSGVINVPFGTAVNIDSYPADYRCVVVYDDANNDMFALAVDYMWGSFGTYIATPIGSQVKGVNPDVCIYNGFTNTVTISYLTTNYKTLYVEQEDFSMLAGGFAFGSVVHFQSAQTGFNYLYPRIACPNPLSSNVNDGDWTVILTELDGLGTYFITSTTSDNNTGINSFYVNDGGYGNAPLHTFANFGPVVAYTYDAGNPPGIILGWNVETTGNSIVVPPTGPFTDDGTTPVVMSMYSSGFFSSINYWEVPVTLANAEAREILSLAGRFSDNSLHCTFMNNTLSDVYTKTVPFISSSTSLRITPIKAEISSDLILNAEIFDVTGRKVLSLKGTKAELSNSLNYELDNHEHAVYILKVHSIDGTYQSTEKIYN